MIVEKIVSRQEMSDEMFVETVGAKIGSRANFERQIRLEVSFKDDSLSNEAFADFCAQNGVGAGDWTRQEPYAYTYDNYFEEWLSCKAVHVLALAIERGMSGLLRIPASLAAGITYDDFHEACCEQCYDSDGHGAGFKFSERLQNAIIVENSRLPGRLQAHLPLVYEGLVSDQERKQEARREREIEELQRAYQVTQSDVGNLFPEMQQLFDRARLDIARFVKLAGNLDAFDGGNREASASAFADLRVCFLDAMIETARKTQEVRGMSVDLSPDDIPALLPAHPLLLAVRGVQDVQERLRGSSATRAKLLIDVLHVF